MQKWNKTDLLPEAGRTWIQEAYRQDGYYKPHQRLPRRDKRDIERTAITLICLFFFLSFFKAIA